MILKTEQSIYDDIVTFIKAACPEITGFTPGSPENAVVRLMAYGISLMYKQLYGVFINIWPTLADLSGLRREYEQFGLTWNSPLLNVARANILAKYRERSIGTPNWYTETAVAEFEDITEAVFVAGIRGVNTGDLYIFSNGGDCLEDTITDCQAYFDDPNRKVVCIDVQVKTLRDMRTDTEAAVALL
jgi:hypothetical protein